MLETVDVDGERALKRVDELDAGVIVRLQLFRGNRQELGEVGIEAPLPAG